MALFEVCIIINGIYNQVFITQDEEKAKKEVNKLIKKGYTAVYEQIA